MQCNKPVATRSPRRPTEQRGRTVNADGPKPQWEFPGSAGEAAKV
jgi:hypothetical protein